MKRKFSWEEKLFFGLIAVILGYCGIHLAYGGTVEQSIPLHISVGHGQVHSVLLHEKVRSIHCSSRRCTIDGGWSVHIHHGAYRVLYGLLAAHGVVQTGGVEPPLTMIRSTACTVTAHHVRCDSNVRISAEGKN